MSQAFINLNLFVVKEPRMAAARILHVEVTSCGMANLKLDLPGYPVMTNCLPYVSETNKVVSPGDFVTSDGQTGTRIVSKSEFEAKYLKVVGYEALETYTYKFAKEPS